MTRKLVICALMLLPLSTAFADQGTYPESGGSFTLGSSIVVTGSTVASPAGSLSLNCPVTNVFYGTYEYQYVCSGGTITMQSTDGATTLNGTFTSGTAYLTASGGGRGGNTHYYYSFSGAVTGTLTQSGQSEPVTGSTYFNVVPLRTQIGSGSAALSGGATEVNALYGPVYVADTSNNQIVRVDSMTGANWVTLGSALGSGAKQFSGPSGIALDATGRIYVADTGNCRIARMDNITGANWTALGACGNGTGKFNGPVGVSIDAGGRIYVADTGNNQIVRMDDMTGANWITLKTDTTGVNTLSGPRNVAFDSLGKIYIADTNNNRVVRVDDMTGANWTMLSASYFSVYGVAVDSEGKIYVADMGANQIVRTDDMTGANRITLGGIGIGNGVGMFYQPNGLALDPLTGAIFVADTQNSRIVRTGDMGTLDWSSYGSFGVGGAGYFFRPQGIAALPVPTPVPDAVIAPASLTYANQNVGTTSLAQSVTVTNIGGAPLVFANIGTTGDFSQTDTCGSSLPGGSTCTLSVVFTPTATGLRTGLATLTDNSAGGAQSATLSGTGTAPIAGVAPTSLTFPSQLVNTTSGAQVIALSNTGTGPLTITAISASAGFGQSNNCGSSVASGAACTISVTFTPTAAGPATGTVTVSSNAPTQSAVLSGTGTSTAPTVTATPASLVFPEEAVNTTSPAQTVTLANHGSTALAITSITTTGNFAKSSTTCTASLGAGRSCTAKVTFKPTATGFRTGTLTFNIPSNAQTVVLSGTGTPAGTSQGLVVSPTALSFSTSPQDTQTYPVTVSNPNGIAAGIASITTSGAHYSKTTTCGSLLAAGATCTINVTLSPPVSGTYNGTLKVKESSGATDTVTLSGIASNN